MPFTNLKVYSLEVEEMLAVHAGAVISFFAIEAAAGVELSCKVSYFFRVFGFKGFELAL